MSTLVKIQRKGQMTIPSHLRAAIGVSEGDRLEASVERGKIILRPTLVVDRSGLPRAADEYTPAPRQGLDARLAKAEADIKHGRLHGPFATHEEMMSFLRKPAGKGRAAKPNRKKK